MPRADILARLRKIGNLARRGDGGEADNAAALLERIAAAHGIDLDAIDEAPVSDHVYRTGAEGWRKDLFCQIVWCRDRDMVLYLCRVGRGMRRDAVKLRCAADFFIDVVAAFEVLSRDYDRQRKALFRAFLATNDLLVKPMPGDKPHVQSDAERRLAEDAWRLSMGIERSALRKQLEGAE